MSSSLNKTHKMFTRPEFPEYAKTTLAVMWKDSKNGLFYDITLISGLDGKKLLAHRSVLCAANDFFRTMFSSNFKEAEEKNVTLSDISADILELLIGYCYTGSIDINEDNVQLLLPQAQLMLFPEVVEACSDFLQSLLYPTNCFDILRYAKLYNCDTLIKKVEEYMQENFINVVVTQEFLYLNDEEVEKYFSSDKLSVSNEKEVFKALMRWINHDQDSRTSSLSKLLSVVRLNHIETSFLFEYVVNISDNHSNLIELTKGLKQNVHNNALPARTGSKPNRLVIVYSCKISVYNPLTLDTEFELSFEPNYYVSTLLGEKVILVGTNVRSFNLKTETWNDLAPTQIMRSCHALAVLNGFIYAVGGREESSVERWNPKLNKWTYVANMQQQRTSACTAVLNGKLYVIGGKTSDDYLSSVEYYDPDSNKWSFCGSMVEERAFAKAVAANGDIYVFGGRNSIQTLSSIEKYNLETDSWSIVSNITTKRWNLGACLYDEKIILFGGFNKECEPTMEEFNLITNQCAVIGLPFSDYKFQ